MIVDKSAPGLDRAGRRSERWRAAREIAHPVAATMLQLAEVKIVEERMPAKPRADAKRRRPPARGGTPRAEDKTSVMSAADRARIQAQAEQLRRELLTDEDFPKQIVGERLTD